MQHITSRLDYTANASFMKFPPHICQNYSRLCPKLSCPSTYPHPLQGLHHHSFLKISMALHSLLDTKQNTPHYLQSSQYPPISLASFTITLLLATFGSNLLNSIRTKYSTLGERAFSVAPPPPTPLELSSSKSQEFLIFTFKSLLKTHLDNRP